MLSLQCADVQYSYGESTLGLVAGRFLHLIEALLRALFPQPVLVLSLIRITVKSVVKASFQWFAFTHTALFISDIIKKVKGVSWKEIYYELHPKSWTD